MASRGTFSVYEDDDPLLSPLSGSESVQASGAVDGRVTTTAAVPVGRSCSAGFSRWGVLAFSLVSYSGLGFGDTFGLYSQAVKNNFNCTQVCARAFCVCVFSVSCVLCSCARSALYTVQGLRWLSPFPSAAVCGATTVTFLCCPRFTLLATRRTNSKGLLWLGAYSSCALHGGKMRSVTLLE